MTANGARETAVVSDSTAYLPASLAERLGITLVSLYYGFGDGALFREVDLADLGAFFEGVRSADRAPTTSPPTVEDFIAVYEPLIDRGRSVVSLHISSGLSETCANARRAAEQMAATGRGGERIHVLDSATACSPLALLAIAAARAAQTGRGAEYVVDAVRQARLEARNWFLLDSLEFLKRGGRIGAATAWIGSTLSVKPILTLEAEITTVERVRSRERGVERLIDFGRQLHAGGATGWAVQHTQAAEDAGLLVDRLQEVFRRPPEVVSELGPVIAAHVGPGMLALGGLPSRFLEH